MVERVESIVEQALGLTESDRATVIRRLKESLGHAHGGCEGGDGGTIDGFFQDAEVKQAWDDEIQRRIEKMARGEMKFTPGHEVVARVREQLRRSRDAQD